MRTVLLSAVLLMVGCQSTVGPWKRSTLDDTIVTPGASLSEQAVQTRDKLPFGDASPAAGPRTYFDNPFSKSGR
jgi:hypothetical protein